MKKFYFWLSLTCGVLFIICGCVARDSENSKDSHISYSEEELIFLRSRETSQRLCGQLECPDGLSPVHIGRSHPHCQCAIVPTLRIRTVDEKDTEKPKEVQNFIRFDANGKSIYYERNAEKSEQTP